MTDFDFVGKRTPLIDGGAKVTGDLKYIADLKMHGLLVARFVLSTYAHANITSIDKQEALAVSGVVAVITSGDLPEIAPTSRSKLMLAKEQVMFVGQPIAMVLADNETAAADGAELVYVDYDPLPAVTDMDSALADDAPLVWLNGVPTGSGVHDVDTGSDSKSKEEKPSNIAGRSKVERGDIEQGFAEADVVVERTFTTPMVHQSSLETQGVMVQPDRVTGGVTVWGSIQSPFDVRLEVAEVLGIPESDVKVHAMPVGGAFGAKAGLYEPLVALLAVTVGRSVRLILTRSEELLTTNPAPALRLTGKLGFKNDGTLVATQASVIADTGIYPDGFGGFGAYLFGTFYPSPNILLESTNVVTFKQSIGAYRAPTAPTAFFAVEMLFDEAAEKLGMDSIELRLKNAARSGDITPDGQVFPPMGMVETLETALEHPLWKNREESKKNGRGVGIAIGGLMGVLEPGATICKLNRDGVLQLQSGSADIAGTTTSLSMLAAETFGVGLDKIRYVYSDTNSGPYAGSVGGSKMLYTLGTAVIRAAEDARNQTLAIASEEFEVSAEDLEIVDGKVRVKGFPDRSITLGEIVAKTMTFTGKYKPVHGTGRQAMTDYAPSFCAQIAEVEVDEETGEIKVINLTAIQDVGRAINPMAVEGQIHGGATQGIGWAIYEGMQYDEDGQLLTGSWMDYAIPDAMQASPIETQILEIPSVSGPLGARGVGEPPVTPTVGAIANAVAHATGVRMSQTPMTAPRVLEELQKS